MASPQEIEEALRLTDISYLEVSCRQSGASTATLGEDFEMLNSGDAYIQSRHEQTDAETLIHDARILVVGPNEVQIRVEVRATYLVRGTLDATPEEHEEFLGRRGLTVLYPYLREAVSACTRRLGLTTLTLPLDFGDFEPGPPPTADAAVEEPPI